MVPAEDAVAQALATEALSGLWRGWKAKGRAGLPLADPGHLETPALHRRVGTALSTFPPGAPCR